MRHHEFNLSNNLVPSRQGVVELSIVDHGRVVGNVSRAAIINDLRITGLSTDVIAELEAEVGPLWHERHQARLESRARKRAIGAGAKHRLVFVDRLLAALVHLRHANHAWRAGPLLRCGPLHHHPGHRRGTSTTLRARLHRHRGSAVTDSGCRPWAPPDRGRSEGAHSRHLADTAATYDGSSPVHGAHPAFAAILPRSRSDARRQHTGRLNR